MSLIQGLLLTSKTKMPMKNVLGQKLRKIAQKIYFLALEIEKTTFRFFFGQKWIFQKNRFFGCSKNLNCFCFKTIFCKLLKKTFFRNCKV